MSDKSLLWLWTHCRAIGMTKKADASEIDSLAMDIALFTADQKGEIERLIDLVAEQRRTIGALNLAIGGKDSTTTENLTHIERLRDELETFRLGKHHQENERLSLQLRDSLAAEEHCQKMRDKAERELAEAQADKDAWMHEFHATIAEQQAQLAEARRLLSVIPGHGLSAFESDDWWNARATWLAARRR